MSDLAINEQRDGSATIWNVTEDGIVIMTFDSRGGYTRADAEAVMCESMGITEEDLNEGAEALQDERAALNLR